MLFKYIDFLKVIPPLFGISPMIRNAKTFIYVSILFKKMRYEVLVKFDNLNCTNEERKTYFSAVDKYHALAIGHSKEGYSTMLIASNEDLSEEILARDLNGLEILSFRINSLAKTKTLI